MAVPSRRRRPRTPPRPPRPKRGYSISSISSTFTSPQQRRQPLSSAMILDAICYLHERNGSTLASIQSVLENVYGYNASQGSLKKRILQALQSGKIKTCRKNFFVLSAGKEGGGRGGSPSSHGLNRRRRRRRRGRRRRRRRGGRKRRRRYRRSRFSRRRRRRRRR